MDDLSYTPAYNAWVETYATGSKINQSQDAALSRLTEYDIWYPFYELDASGSG